MTSLFEIRGQELVPVSKTVLDAEDSLEGWIFQNPQLIGLDILPLGRQVHTDHQGRIDILAMDQSGDLVVIELKKDRTPRDVVAQILDYASWISSLTTRRVHDIALEKLKKPLEEVFLERFEAPLPEDLNNDHSMVIVASELDASSKRIVEYLAQTHGLSINTAFFDVFERDGKHLLATQWLMDQQEVEERSESKRKLPWSGLWYVNVGDGPHRSWEDMRTYGFLAAGHGRVYSKRLEQLSVGDPVYAYQKQAGYVGYGTVTQLAGMVKDFEVDGDPLLDLPLDQPNLAHDKDNPEMAEYVVGVNWKKTFSLSEAKAFPGIFANQNVVCKLRDPQTIEFLKRTFA